MQVAQDYVHPKEIINQKYMNNFIFLISHMVNLKVWLTSTDWAAIIIISGVTSACVTALKRSVATRGAGSAKSRRSRAGPAGLRASCGGHVNLIYFMPYSRRVRCSRRRSSPHCRGKTHSKLFCDLRTNKSGKTTWFPLNTSGTFTSRLGNGLKSHIN